MIPKIIHYCWFGHNPLPKSVKKYMRTWKRYCKGYQIIEWNEENFDISSAPLFVRQAYEAKKWAFVTDYVRLFAMINYGGIYMDTDVEVVKPLDQFLKHRAFSGFESETRLMTAIMACEKGFPLFEQFLHSYDSLSFINRINPDGSFVMDPNTVMLTNFCLERGLVLNNQFQTVEGLAIYPNDFFSPRNYYNGYLTRTKNTHAIHWFNSSWLPERFRRANQEKYARLRKQMRKRLWKQRFLRFLRCILGNRLYLRLKELKNRLLGH